MNSSAMNTNWVSNDFVPASLERLPSIWDLRFFSIMYSWQWRWCYIAYLFLAWQTSAIIWRFWWKAPTNIAIAAYPTPLGRWLTAIRMLFDADTLVQQAYNEFGGKPFAIPMLERWIVFVSDRDQLKHLESEPELVLSMENALHELAFTSSIMGHLQVRLEHTGRQSESLRVGLGVLKNKLRSTVPAMSDSLRMRVRDAVALEVAPLNDKSSQEFDGNWKRVRLMPALLRIFTRVNLFVFIGEDQAGRSEVYEDIMRFFSSCSRAFPILMLVPGFLSPLIGPVVMGCGRTRQKVYSLLLWLTRQALGQEGQIYEEKPQNRRSVTQWVAEISRLQDATEIAKISLGLLFASAFQVPVVTQFAIDRMCRHPKYQERLIAEAAECKDVSFGSSNQEMPYLDSFIKETARLSPGVIFSAPRAVMVPYKYYHGFHVPTGNWLAIPQVSLMRDENIWQQATSFEGFRFVDKSDGVSKSRLTHPSYDFPFWGSIQHACPARFYVSVIMKMVLTHLMVEYEFKLEDSTTRPVFNFSYARLPNPFLAILIRKRVVSKDKKSC